MVDAKKLLLVVDWLSSKNVVFSVDSLDSDSVDLLVAGELVGELWYDSVA